MYLDIQSSAALLLLKSTDSYHGHSLTTWFKFFIIYVI